MFINAINNTVETMTKVNSFYTMIPLEVNPALSVVVVAVGADGAPKDEMESDPKPKSSEAVSVLRLPLILSRRSEELLPLRLDLQ